MSPKYLRLASDLHLEGFYGRPIDALAVDLLPADPRDIESILILAGDISSYMDQLLSFIDAVSPRFAHVIYVQGNHEYYRHDYDVWNTKFRDLAAKLTIPISSCPGAVGMLIIEKNRFIFATLWADGGKSPLEQMMVDRGLNDFRLIEKNNYRFTVHDMMALHQEQKAEISRLLQEPFDGKTVVITHHMPTYRLCHPRFGSEINGGFAANCDDILASDSAPSIWIFGHTHDTHDDVMWNTRLIGNPAGYRGEWNTSFNTYLREPKFVSL